MTHIVVIEDERSLRVLLGRLLSDAGYRVTTADSGSAGLNVLLSEHDVDMVILDLMLPDLSGEEVLHVLLAAKPEVRVLVLSSVHEVGRRVGILDAGAADFVAKPFVNAELLARIRTQLRSKEPATAAGTVRYLNGSGFQLDLQRRELVTATHRTLLPHREFVLLAHLLHRQGQVCTRQELLSDVWGMTFDPGTNVVDVYVRRLRAKLSANCIETVRNVGYRLVAC
ncbi:MAG TPA: response regulator transcription factor [Jatrophihabitans sp.]|nr:response regulator transcription factor [Jatrophihabitans sp.]